MFTPNCYYIAIYFVNLKNIYNRTNIINYSWQSISIQIIFTVLHHHALLCSRRMFKFRQKRVFNETFSQRPY